MEQFGRYTLVREIGRGGTATVFLAKDTVFGDVVLKIMSSQVMPAGIDHEKLLIDEARRTIELHHKNIVRVHTAVEKSPDTESAYIVMEHLSGGTLKDRIQRNLPYSPTKVLREIASALEYCYQEKGIIHRDLKPSNILFRESSGGELSAVLTDFGISKNQDDKSDFTSIGLRVGTPKYMSPEQFYGESLTQRSDLYSLGIIFYEMLVGSVPYESNETTTIIKTITRNERPKLPEEHKKYQPIIDNLLSALPEERFLNARKLINALDDIEASPSKGVKKQSSSKNQAVMIGASIVAALGVGIGAYKLFFDTGNEETEIPERKISVSDEITPSPIKITEKAKLPAESNEPKLKPATVVTDESDTENTQMVNDVEKFIKRIELSKNTNQIQDLYSLKDTAISLIEKYPQEEILNQESDLINNLINEKIASLRSQLEEFRSYNNSDDLSALSRSISKLANYTSIPKDISEDANTLLREVSEKRKLLSNLSNAVSLSIKHPKGKKVGISPPTSIDDLSILTLKTTFPSYLYCTYRSPDGITVRLYPIPEILVQQLPYMKNTKDKYTRYGQLNALDQTLSYLGESSAGKAEVICYSSNRSLETVFPRQFKLDGLSDILTVSPSELEQLIETATKSLYGKNSLDIEYK